MDEDRASRTQNRLAAAQRWRDWLVPAMERAKMRQIDVVRNSNGQLQPAVVSKWVNGEFSASPQYAVLVARILDADPIEALKAAGHHDIVAAMARNPVAGGELGDTVMSAVRDDLRLSEAQRRFVLEMYRADVLRLVERAMAIVEQLAAANAAK